MTYVTYLFGFPVHTFHCTPSVAWMLFHGLDFSAFLVCRESALALAADAGQARTPAIVRDGFLPARSYSSRSRSPVWPDRLHALDAAAALYSSSRCSMPSRSSRRCSICRSGSSSTSFSGPRSSGVKLYQQAGAEDAGATVAAAATLRFRDADRGSAVRAAPARLRVRDSRTTNSVAGALSALQA